MEAEKPAGKRQRIKYDVAFRSEAVSCVTQDRQETTRIVQELGISGAILGYWVRVSGRKPPAQWLAL
jgi:transposase